jgi:translation initiation factor IF-2
MQCPRWLQFVSVSSVTGEGVADFFDKVAAAAREYNEAYKPELDRIKNQKVPGHIRGSSPIPR